MTLEVSVVEVIEVGDVFGAIRQFFAKIIHWLSADDVEAKDEDTKDQDDNKSPPEPEETPPADLGVQVADKSKPRESFGP